MDEELRFVDNIPLELVKDCEILIGLPSYNESDTIAFVVEQVSRGLKTYFAGKKVAIINLDGKSIDGTQDMFLGASSAYRKIEMETTLRGKGNAFKIFFESVKNVKPRAAAVFDADLKSISPE